MLKRLLLVALLCLFPTIPAGSFTTDNQEDICAQSWVIFCENFETYLTGAIVANYAGQNAAPFLPAHFKNSGWTGSDCYWLKPYPSNGSCGTNTGGNTAYPNGSLQIQTSQRFDGTKALQFELQQNDGAGLLEYLGNFNISEGWFRVMVKWETNWVESGPQSGGGAGGKRWFIGTSSFSHNLLCGDTGPGGGPTGIGAFNCVFQRGNPITNHYVALAQPIHDGQWHCVEIHLRMNSTNSANDGLYETWHDGVLLGSFANANVDAAGTKITGIHPDGFWNCEPNHASTTKCPTGWGDHPLQHRWFDNMVVGTQRIGCPGSVPLPTTLPKVTGVIFNLNGATVTGEDGLNNPAITMRVESFSGLPGDVINEFPAINAFPGWPLAWAYNRGGWGNRTSACFHARDSTGAEDPVAFVCGPTVSTDVTPPLPPSNVAVE